MVIIGRCYRFVTMLLAERDPMPVPEVLTAEEPVPEPEAMTTELLQDPPRT